MITTKYSCRNSTASGAEGIDEIAADFADDAVMITPAGVNRGKDGVRKAYKQIFADLPHNYRLM